MEGNHSPNTSINTSSPRIYETTWKQCRQKALNIGGNAREGKSSLPPPQNYFHPKTWEEEKPRCEFENPTWDVDYPNSQREDMHREPTAKNKNFIKSTLRKWNKSTFSTVDLRKALFRAAKG